MIIAGLDFGMGAMKLYSEHGSFVVQSSAALATGRREYELGGNGVGRMERPQLIKFDSESYYVGSRAHSWGAAIDNLSTSRLLGSVEAKALFYASMTGLLKQFQTNDAPELILGVGLPLELLVSENVNSNKAKISAWLRGEHCWVADEIEYRINVKKVKIVQQAIALLQDHILNRDGEFKAGIKALTQGEVGYATIGHRTIEVITLSELKVDASKTRGITAAGVSALIRMIDPEQLYTTSELNERLMRQPRKVAGQKLDSWTRNVLGHFDAVWGESWKRFEAVFVSGGGVHLMNGELSDHFGVKLVVPDEPVIAQARGIYKFLVSLAVRGKL